MNALMQGLGCLGCLDGSSDGDACEAPAPQPLAAPARVHETELRARDDGTRNYRLERRAVAWACEDAVRRCADAAVDAALDESLRDALDARLGLKDEMAACGLAEGELPLAFGSSRRPRRQPKKKKRKKAPGPSRLADAPNPQRGVDDKYWAQRFHYFSLYDCGIQLDAESWYSVTPEKIALAIAARCRPTDVVVDAFCGCGGNAIALARRCRHVVAIDIDAAKVEKARRNARIYGVAVDFVVGDALVLLKTLRADVCFLSPPWGGPGYGADFRLEAIDVQGVDGFGLLRLAAACAPRVAYYLPRTLSVEEAARLAPVVEVESQYLNDKLKAKTVYIGFEEAVPVVASLDGVADALSTIGCAQLLVDDDLHAHNAAASELWRAFFAADEAHRRQFALADGADSGGYHSSGMLGRYNAHRSGVIYEHDEAVPELIEGVDFVAQVEAWRGAVTALARDVLGAVAARRGAPAHMFAAGGAFDARAAGRFHVKRTHAGAARVLLPAHRDPSTLSLVVHFSAPPSGLELCGNPSSRRVRADSSRQPPRHRRAACSMAWRCWFITAGRGQHGSIIAKKDLVKNCRVHPTHWLIPHRPRGADAARLGALRTRGAGSRHGPRRLRPRGGAARGPGADAPRRRGLGRGRPEPPPRGDVLLRAPAGRAHGRRRRRHVRRADVRELARAELQKVPQEALMMCLLKLG